MSRLTAFVGGSIGSNPLGSSTWSGSAPFFLRALDDRELLDRSVGVQLPRLRNLWLMGKNFHRDRAVWRKHFYFDPAYRRAMTAAATAAVESPTCLQIGHWYNLAEAFPGKRCLSYHDGNLPGVLLSGFNLEGVSRCRIDQALRYEEETAQQMAAVLTFSEYVRQSFIHDYHLPPEKVVNVGGGVNLAELPPVLPKDYTAPRLLFIGIEFGRKGGPQLLQAFAIVRQTLPAAELHIVGPARLDHQPPGVVFHGRLSKADPIQKAQLDSLFRDCNLFVLPSLYEPFGIAPLEAMLNRLPCLLTDAWAFREFVTPGLNGDLVEKGSVEDLAAKMQALLADPTALARMGAHARERVLANYTWPAVATRIATVLDHL